MFRRTADALNFTAAIHNRKWKADIMDLTIGEPARAGSAPRQSEDVSELIRASTGQEQAL